MVELRGEKVKDRRGDEVAVAFGEGVFRGKIGFGEESGGD